MNRILLTISFLALMFSQVLLFSSAQAKSRPDWAKEGAYLVYSWDLWKYCPVEEVDSKIEERNGGTYST